MPGLSWDDTDDQTPATAERWMPLCAMRALVFALAVRDQRASLVPTNWLMLGEEGHRAEAHGYEANA